MSEPVFCRHCQYVDRNDGGLVDNPYVRQSVLCMRSWEIYTSFYTQYKLFDKAATKNEHNDCPDFKLKLWRRIVNICLHVRKK